MTQSEGRGRGWSGAVAAAIVVGAWLGATAPAVAAEGLIYASAWQADGFSAFGTDLRRQLSSRFDYDLGRVDGDVDVLRLVRADPRHVGFVQRDTFVDRLRRSPAEFDRLEFYGNVAACLLAVTRIGSPIQTYDDLVAANRDRKATLDVGATTGRVAATFEMLRGMDSDLDNLRLEHRGGSRAMSRVVSGETDVALFIAYAPFRLPPLDGLIDKDLVDLVPFVSRNIAAAALRQSTPYAFREIELGDRGWLRSARKYSTTCTSLGIVVNEKADVRLSEAVAQAMLQAASGDDGGYSVAWFQDLVAGAIGRIALWVREAGEVAIAWVFGAKEPAGTVAADPPAADGGTAVSLRPVSGPPALRQRNGS